MSYSLYVLLIILAGANTVMVRITNRSLPPFWGAGSRFLMASAAFFCLMLIQRIPFPRGRDLVGALAYGLVQFGLGYGFTYLALGALSADMLGIILASVPLFTLFFAVLAHIERFRILALVGGIMVVAGMAFVFSEGFGRSIPLTYLLAGVASAACFALAPVIIKLYPPRNNTAANAVGMLAGALLLLLAALIKGERALLPADSAAWLAQIYLVAGGGVGFFVLLLYLLKRLTATSVSYQLVLSPIATILLSAWLLHETLTIWLLIGGLLVLAGVYIGALLPGKPKPPTQTAVRGDPDVSSH
ncbi:MAG: DMT family transporter [Anaerolineae bacterium]